MRRWLCRLLGHDYDPIEQLLFDIQRTAFNADEAKAERVAKLQLEKAGLRLSALGYVMQPIGDKAP